ncbi:hypothetical protein FDX19_01850 [Citrobacter sp. wls619]|uniref:hypothetical protein n=1 Tax=Citrobacter sp. wls619 TaxID=2576432 RepID=UPI0010CA154F|nr:hypothetical protein [Citrobacter sp. wls619]TKV13933.1 hypothetical protein FDX19_01850 [Citrobacter sp. wls619]
MKQATQNSVAEIKESARNRRWQEIACIKEGEKTQREENPGYHLTGSIDPQYGVTDRCHGAFAQTAPTFLPVGPGTGQDATAVCDQFNHVHCTIRR